MRTKPAAPNSASHGPFLVSSEKGPDSQRDWESLRARGVGVGLAREQDGATPARREHLTHARQNYALRRTFIPAREEAHRLRGWGS
jgi:hypothetical protein